MTDPISDMIIRVKNAGDAGRRFVYLPYSKMRYSVAEILKKEGFIKSVSSKDRLVKGSKNQASVKFIEIEILFGENKNPRINGVQRLSKPSKRVYLKAREIYPVKNRVGRMIISTPKGIMTDLDARKMNFGGEALFKIW